jgi:hypothetical protein
MCLMIRALAAAISASGFAMVAMVLRGGESLLLVTTVLLQRVLEAR